MLNRQAVAMNGTILGCVRNHLDEAKNDRNVTDAVTAVIHHTVAPGNSDINRPFQLDDLIPSFHFPFAAHHNRVPVRIRVAHHHRRHVADATAAQITAHTSHQYVGDMPSDLPHQNYTSVDILQVSQSTWRNDVFEPS